MAEKGTKNNQAMIDLQRTLLNNLFYTSMNNSDNWMSSHPLDEQLPHLVRLILLQTAVRS